jgi:hypothetical protein
MKKNKEIQISNHGKGENEIMIVRYESSEKIHKMMMDDKFVEAFVHTQLCIEKILWNKIVAVFEGEKAIVVRRTIEENGEDKQHTKTYELIKWAHFLHVIDDKEFNELKDFNSKRNKLLHGHGEWWEAKYKEDYKEALSKAINFWKRIISKFYFEKMSSVDRRNTVKINL